MIILASASPRRREILSNLKLDFEIKSSDVDEILDESKKPHINAMSLALKKSLDIAMNNKNDIVIGADTIVVHDGKILGKPCNEQDAFDMLKKLSGTSHQVITGISVIKFDEDKKVIDYEITSVQMKKLDDDKIKRYINTKEPLDKAGSYGIQGFGALLIDKIDGDYFNVVGLPISKLDEILNTHFDVNII